MKLPVALQMEFMGAIWIIIFLLSAIAYKILEHWKYNWIFIVFATLSCIIGIIYLYSSTKRVEKDVQQQTETKEKDEQGPDEPCS